MKNLPAFVIVIGIVLLAVAVVYLNRGDEICPPAIHELHAFCDSRHLHYRAVLRQLGNDAPYWDITVWPASKHWWQEDSWFAAGTSIPDWEFSAVEVNDAISGIIQKVNSDPAGMMWKVPHQLQKCEH